MIDFEHVSKEYKKGGRLALEDINFHVDEGEFVFLLGHSGAGKSTLLKLILRETLPTSGKVTVLGKDVAKLRRHKIPYLRRQMGIIFQDFRLIPSMTVYENVAFAMHVLNVPRKEIRPRVEYILELVHLEDKAKCYPDTLSGGEQQRVAVARALVHNPKLVIADEPTGNIDPELSSGNDAAAGAGEQNGHHGAGGHPRARAGAPLPSACGYPEPWPHRLGRARRPRGRRRGRSFAGCCRL